MFHISARAGRPSNTVTIASIDTTSVGSNLQQANISCSGGPKNVTIQGGPSLEAFSRYWKGLPNTIKRVLRASLAINRLAAPINQLRMGLIQCESLSYQGM